jgi:hypothetical protein
MSKIEYCGIYVFLVIWCIFFNQGSQLFCYDLIHWLEVLITQCPRQNIVDAPFGLQNMMG